jgi:hypothetical protein
VTVPQNDKRWRKSRRSQNEGACVELHPTGALRDSKNPAGPILKVRFSGLVSSVKAGHLTR